MKYKLTDGDKDYLEYIEKQTLTKCKIDEQGYMEINEFFNIFDNMLSEIEYLEEEINDLQHNEDGSIRAGLL